MDTENKRCAKTHKRSNIHRFHTTRVEQRGIEAHTRSFHSSGHIHHTIQCSMFQHAHKGIPQNYVCM